MACHRDSQRWDRLYRALERFTDVPPAAHVPDAVAAALDDDLNTPIAMAEMAAIATALNRATDDAEKARLAASLKAAGAVLGVLQKNPTEWLAGDKSVDEAAVQRLFDARNAARKAKDFAEADRLRKQLSDMGVVIEDRPDGPIWRIAG